MKLAVSAFLLSVAIATPTFAQSAPATGPEAPPQGMGMHRGGPHGPHGPGMFGSRMAAHRVETIANAPITAQFTQVANFTDRQGKQEQRSSTSTVYRDSQGRVREEFTLPTPPPRPPAAADSGTVPQAPRGPRTMITILDPVAHTITRLDAERQTASVRTVPADFFTRAQQHEDSAASGQQPQQKADHGTTTSLGSKMFAGVSATGMQTAITFPARDGGATHTITRQSWFSPDLKFEVSSSETDDRGTHSVTLSSLTKAEPNPNLFQVPAGYTVTSAPEHPFGGQRRGGSGGPGGQGGDDMPPPPPSM